jgi:hypothetical protein
MASSARAKGTRNQNKVKDLFTRMGYLCDDVERRGRHLKQKDLYGLFDLISVHPTEKPCLIQVTSNTPHTHKLYLEFSKSVSTYQLVVQVIWVDRLGFIGYIYLPDNTKITVDGRKLSVAEFTEKFRQTISLC